MAGDFDDFDDFDNLGDLTEGMEDDSFIDDSSGQVNKRKVVKAITNGALAASINKENLRKTIESIAADSKALPAGYSPIISDLLGSFDTIRSDLDKSRDELKAPIKDIKKLINSKIDKISILPKSVRDKIKEKTQGGDETSGPREPTQEDLTAAELGNIFGNEIDKKMKTVDQLNTQMGIELGKSQVEFSKDSAISLRRLVGYQNTINFKYQRKSLEAQLTQVAISKELLRITKASSTDTVESLKAIVNNTGLPDSLKLSLAEGVAKDRNEAIYGGGNKVLGGAINPLINQMTAKLGRGVRSITGGVKGLGSAANGIGEASESMADIPLSTRLEILGSMLGGKATSMLGRGASRLATKAINTNQASQRLNDKVLFNLENPEVLGQNIREKVRSASKGTFAEDFIHNRTMGNGRSNTIEAGVEKGSLTKLTQRANFTNQTQKAVVEVIPRLLAKQLSVLNSINGTPQNEIVYDYSGNEFTSVEALGAKARTDIVGDFANKQDKYVSAVTKGYRLKAKSTLSKEADAALRNFIIESAVTGMPLRMERLKNATMSENPEVQAELVTFFSQNLGDATKMNLSTGRIANELRTGYEDIQKKLNKYASAAQHDALKATGLLDGKGKFKANQLENSTRENAFSEYSGRGTKETYRPKAKSASNPTNSSSSASARPTLGTEDLYVESNDTPVITKEGIKSGKYFDSSTGKVITHADDIKSDVVDKKGKIIASIADLSKGLFNAAGKKIESSAVIMKNAKDRLAKLAKDTTLGGKTVLKNNAETIGKMRASASKTASRIKDRIISLGDHDLYTIDGLKPVLTSADIKAGEYFDAISGKVIKTVNDIKSDIIDSKGRVVATSDQLKDGLVNAMGESIEGNKTIIRAAKDNLSNKYKNVVSNAPKNLSALRSKIMGAAASTYEKLNSSEDVYVAGETTPRMTKVQMDNGEYSSNTTGKPVTTIGEIDGPIVDKDRNVVLTVKDIDKGIVDKDGRTIMNGFIARTVVKTLNLAKRIAWGAAKIQYNYTRGVLRLAGRAVTGKLFNKRTSEDVYVAGEDTPRLTKVRMDRGDYILTKTGKFVFAVSDIDGPVSNKEGLVLISEEDIKDGLIDSKGRKIKHSKLMQNLKKLITVPVGMAKNLLIKGVKLQGKYLGKLGRGVKGIGSGLLGALKMGQGKSKVNSKKPNVEYDKEGKPSYDRALYELMSDDIEQRRDQEAAARSANRKNTNDSDGDGLRDGGWRSLLRRKKKPTVKEKDEKEVEKEAKPSGMLAMAIAALSGILGGLPGKLTKLFTGGIAKLLKGLLASRLLGSLGGDGGIDVDGIDGKSKKTSKVPKTKGKLGKWAKLKNLGSRAYNATKTVGGNLLKKVPIKAAAGFGLKKVAGVAAAGTAAVLGAPAIATAAAVSGIAYTAYEAFSFFYDRRTPKDWDKLRYLEYGLNIEDGSSCSKIRELEEELEDELIWRNGVPTFNISLDKAVEDYGEDIFDLDSEDAVAKRNWVLWYTGRFIPVYSRWLDTLKKVEPSFDLDECDDLEGSKISKMLEGVGLAVSRMNPNPLLVLNSPFDDSVIYINKEQIVGQIKVLMKDAPAITVDTSVIKDAKDADDDKESQTNREIIKTAAVTRTMSTSRRQRRMPSVPVVAKPATSVATTTVTNVAKQAPVLKLDKSTSASLSNGSFKPMLPVKVNFRISSPYGNRVHPITKKVTLHKGIDIAAPQGTPVYATEKGVCYRVYRSTSYGNCIYMKHDNGMASRYAHMHGFASGIYQGKEVNKGDLIGYVGNTGASAGNHLHFEFRTNLDQFGPTIDPLKLISGSYAKDIREEEKAVKKSAKEESKVNASENIEGLDTVASTVLKQGAPSATPSTAETKAAAKGVTTQESNSFKVKTNVNTTSNSPAPSSSNANMSSNMVKTLTASFAQRDKDNSTAITQRNSMIAHLGEIKKSVAALASKGGVSAPSQGTAASSQPSASRKTNKPVVDLS